MSKKSKNFSKPYPGTKNLSLGEVNSQLMKISNQIESKMKFLQEKYGFDLDYSFKPITMEELKNFKEK